MKKAEDLVKMRARKVQGGWGRVYPFTGRRGSGAARHQDTRVKEDEIDASALEALSLSDNIGELHGRNVTKSTSVSAEVKLADLVTFRSKPRKGLGLGSRSRFSYRMSTDVLLAAEGDFEVVPHVRSVIVLDDAATRDIEVDEPWEHIYGEDNVNVNGGASLSGSVTPTKAPSYADVLSFSSK